MRAAELTNAADEVLAAVRENSQKAKDVVNHVGDLATGLELSQQPKVDSALTEARQIKSDIAGIQVIYSTCVFLNFQNLLGLSGQFNGNFYDYSTQLHLRKGHIPARYTYNLNYRKCNVNKIN